MCSSTPGRLCSCVHVTMTCPRQHTPPSANLYSRHLCLRHKRRCQRAAARHRPTTTHRARPGPTRLHRPRNAVLCMLQQLHSQSHPVMPTAARCCPRHSGAPPTCRTSSHRQVRQPLPALHACCSIRSLVLLQHVGSQPRTHKHTVTVSHNQSLHATPEASLARKIPSPRPNPAAQNPRTKTRTACRAATVHHTSSVTATAVQHPTATC